MRRNLSRTFFSLFLLLLPLAVFGQSERGAIIGLITDSTGSLVPVLAGDSADGLGRRGGDERDGRLRFLARSPPIAMYMKPGW